MAKVFQDRFSVTDVDRAVLDEWLDDRLHELHTAQPAQVIDFNSFDRTATIRLGVLRDLKGLALSVPPILKVPVSFPASSSYGMTWPIKSGDTGLAIFSESSIDTWWINEDGTETPQNPRDLRMHDYSDAFFIPHVMRSKDAIDSPAIEDDSVCIYSRSSDKESKIKLKDDGTFCIETDNGEFLEVLNEALTKLNIATGGVATQEIAKLLLMKC